MTTKQLICTLAVLFLAACSTASSAADVPAGTTTAVLVTAPAPSSSSPVAPAPVPTTAEAGASLALAAGAVLAAMTRRREADASPEAYGTTTAEVWAAIEATVNTVPGYFEGHCAGRSATGDGSTCWRWGKACPDAAAVLDALLDVIWMKYDGCPNLISGCKAYKAAIPGTIDLRQVSDLADDTLVRWVNPGHGYQYPTVEGVEGEYTDFTTLIVGPEAGVNVVYTFHPGNPIRPSQISADADTTNITSIAALKAAYPEIEWVKVAHTA